MRICAYAREAHTSTGGMLPLKFQEIALGGDHFFSKRHRAVERPEMLVLFFCTCLI